MYLFCIGVVSILTNTNDTFQALKEIQRDTKTSLRKTVLYIRLWFFSRNLKNNRISARMNHTTPPSIKKFLCFKKFLSRTEYQESKKSSFKRIEFYPRCFFCCIRVFFIILFVSGFPLKIVDRCQGLEILCSFIQTTKAFTNIFVLLHSL
jgi:hypothetical protein